MTTLLVASAALAVAPGASARATNEPNVTASTISQLLVAKPFGKASISVNKVENCLTSPQGSYSYVLSMGNLTSSLTATCSLTRNGRQLASGVCGTVSGALGGIPLGASGSYTLTVNGKKMAIFTYRQPKPSSPPPLSPAVCAITSAAVGPASGNAQEFVLTNNGQCTNGTWSWNATYNGQLEMYEVFTPGPDGKVTVLGVSSPQLTTQLSFVFMPPGYQVLTAVTFQQAPGSTVWTPIPQTQGF